MVALYMYLCCMIARACDDNVMLLWPGTWICATAALVRCVVGDHVEIASEGCCADGVRLVVLYSLGESGEKASNRGMR
jgi:hypothetical protein